MNKIHIPTKTCKICAGIGLALYGALITFVLYLTLVFFTTPGVSL